MTASEPKKSTKGVTCRYESQLRFFETASGIARSSPSLCSDFGWFWTILSVGSAVARYYLVVAPPGGVLLPVKTPSDRPRGNAGTRTAS